MSKGAAPSQGPADQAAKGGWVLVTGLVDASVFLPYVELPVGVEVAVGVQGVELEDGFGAVET